ncbi:response regulator transcription factor [Trueperella abortisuis]|uniref:DNA-binding NarL/FixJ family response regulator n=1 Tax=Trueperella abortisuis TaxID=445930 RepID=A0ABT9PFF6_9ACTO|nr:response regulator transcription factor [Trueperella abortisuis]MDP9831446.1 DNA-binding NarL/FixJ family response regulator [Trueperella abortisuis]
MKIFLADDATLVREGLAGILERVGHTVVGQSSDAPTTLAAVRELRSADPGAVDVLVTDVRMPPTMSDDGLRVAVDLRADFPDLSVMVLSQYVAPAYASALFDPVAMARPGADRGGLGYLLKERVARVADFVHSLSIVAGGGVVVDPEVAVGLVRGKASALDALTPRESEVLELMAQGKSNTEIAAQLYLSGAAVSKHVANVFSKLGLPAGEENRRVRAVLTYLTATGAV